MKKSELMKKIKDEITALKESPLYEYRLQNEYFPVIGEGSCDAEIMLVGEAPGKKEAETGKPFCGRSGAVLDKLLLSVGLLRENIYITSIVKDRPPHNRDPRSEEIALYGPYLDRQIEIIKPKIIGTLGRFSTEYIFKKFGLGDSLEPIGALHGKLFETKAPYGKLLIAPLYHPAVALYKGTMMTVLTEDFQIMKRSL